MSIVNDLNQLTVEQIENIEKLTLRWLVQATLDFGIEAYDIFKYSPDNVKDVAEDITREIAERLAGYNLSQRIFGTVDYKKARYIILPDQIVRQALFLDSKAEKTETTATLQITQTSMEIRQLRGGVPVTEQGLYLKFTTMKKVNFLAQQCFSITTMRMLKEFINSKVSLHVAFLMEYYKTYIIRLIQKDFGA